MGVVWTVFSCLSFLSNSPSLTETARYRLKYCLKGPLNPKQASKQLCCLFSVAWSFGVQLVVSVLLHYLYHVLSQGYQG